MRKLKVLHLDSIKISEVSFPPDVCPNLKHLSISNCEIVEVGALPTNLEILDLCMCGALKKIDGLSVVEKLENLSMKGRYNINLQELLPLPVLEALVNSLKVFMGPRASDDDDSRDNLETLVSILRSKRNWCNRCIEGILPTF